MMSRTGNVPVTMTYRFYQLLKSHPLTDSPALFKRFVSSESGKRLSVLSRSTLFLQDGVSINELPILIRKLDHSLIPVVRNKLTLDDIQKISEHDEFFKMKLQDCKSVKQVFRLLEIPSEQVTAYTAAFALDRLCQLQRARSSEFETIHSFIRGAVLKELCDTIIREPDTLTNETLLKMINCSISVESIPGRTLEGLILEVEKRLADCKFALTDLCSILHLLEKEEKYSDLVDNIHIHLGHRCDDLDSKNIVKVYTALALMKTSSRKSTLNLMEQTFLKFWWQMTNSDTASILTALVRVNLKSMSVLSSFGKLLFLNIQNFEVKELKQVIYAYIHFNFPNVYLFKALEKYVSAKNDNLNSNLAALVMEYCRSTRHLSVPIFDTVASHVRRHGHTYSAEELFLILRPFGHLNYLPTRAGPTFVKIEEYLMEKFDEFSPAKMLELLTSFAYIERFPINFVKKVFTPWMFSMVNNMTDQEARDNAGRNLSKLQSAVINEWRDCRLPYVFTYDATADRWTDANRYRLLCDTRQYLLDVLPQYYVHQLVNLEQSSYYIDFVLEPRIEPRIESSQPSLSARDPPVKLALMMTSHNHLCINTRSPLGDHAMKLRHIRLQGYQLVQISQTLYARDSDKREYLRQVLHKYILQNPV